MLLLVLIDFIGYILVKMDVGVVVGGFSYLEMVMLFSVVGYLGSGSDVCVEWELWGFVCVDLFGLCEEGVVVEEVWVLFCFFLYLCLDIVV